MAMDAYNQSKPFMTYKTLIAATSRERVLKQLQEKDGGMAADHIESTPEAMCRCEADSPVSSATGSAPSVELPSLQSHSNEPAVEAAVITPSQNHQNREQDTTTAEQDACCALDNFFMLSLDMLCILDCDGRFKRVNPSFERVLGYSSPELLTKSLFNLLHPDDRVATEAMVHGLALDGQPVSIETRCRCMDGSYKGLFWNLSADASRQLIYAAAHDVTRHREAEEAKRRTDKFLTSIVENIPHMIFVKDAQDLRFVRINKAEEEMMGLSQAEMLGKNDYELFPGEEANFFIGVDRSVLEGRLLLDIPEETVHCAKGARIFHTKKIPIFDDAGQPQYLLGISEDITEQKQAEEELRSRNALMQADLDLARAMQEAFIVRQYPRFPRAAASGESALDFYHRYIPDASLGGDFFHVTALSDTCAGVFICDVMGHGVRSALVTAMMRALVGEQRAVAADPGAFLTVINRHLHGILEQSRTSMFASAFYMVIDTGRGLMSFANAGHPSPLRVRRSENTVERLMSPSTPSGPALGVFTDASYKTASCDLAADDLVVLFTDGLFEVQCSDDEYGEDRLQATLCQKMHLPVDTMFDELLTEIREFSANCKFSDDVCMIGVNATRLL